MNILVFGGAGFIGNAVVEKCITSGHKVVSVDNLITGNIENLKKLGVKNIEIDITNKVDFNKINFNPDIVIHLAFPTPLCNRNVENQFEQIASTGMLNVLEYVKKTCNKIIYGSSISVYGIPDKLPITENNLVSPLLIYGANKVLDELYIRCYNSQFGVQFNILRISDTFGEFDKRGNAINNFINAYINKGKIHINGNGEQIRTFTYVRDMANAFCLATEKLNNGIYNISSSKHLSINKLIEILSNLFNDKREVIYNDTCRDTRNYIICSDKFCDDFGSFENIGVEKGIENTISHLKNTL